VAEEGATTAADDLRYRRQTGSRYDLVISNKLLPADLYNYIIINPLTPSVSTWVKL